MSASDIGIRMSLIGGKAVADQTAMVAGTIDDLGASAAAATPAVTELGGGLDLLGAAGSRVAGVSSEDTISFLRQSVATDTLIGSTTDLIAETNILNAAALRSNEEFIALQGSTTGLSARMASMGISTATVGADFAKMGKYAGIALAATAAIVAYESVKMAVSFSGAVASVAASGNISVKAAGAIGNAFLGLAGSTEYSAQDMMTAYSGVAGQLSTLSGKALNTKQSLNFMITATKLADASGQDLTSTTAALGSTMQVYGFNINKAAWASNILFNTSRLTNNSLSSLATVTARLHSRLGQVMPSLQDTSALILDLAEHGAKGARGTQVVVSGLNTLLGGSKSVNSMLEVLGLTATSFVGPNGKFIGMANAIALLQPRLDKLPQNIQLIAERTLFGAGASQLLGKVVLSGAGMFDTASKSVNKYGVVNSSAAKQIKSVDGQLRVIKGAVHDFMIEVGNFLLPKLIAFGRWMLAHKPILEGFAIAIGITLVAAFGAWIVSLDTATIAAAAFWVAMTGGTIIAVTALIAGVLWLSTHWKQTWTDIRNWIDDAGRFIDNIMHNKIVLALMGPIGPMIYLAEHWKTVWNGIKTVIKDVWHFIEPIFHAVEKGLGVIGNVLSKVGGFLGGAAHMLGFAEGGVVPGPTGQPMIAMVHGGEVIVPPSNIYNSSSVSPTLLGMAANRLAPAGTGQSVVPSQILSGGGLGTGQPILIQLVVDRKVLAQTVYQQMAADYARR